MKRPSVKADPESSFKEQSSMEYLLTYGWAILIIAIVLGALFSLGIIGGNGNLPTQCTAASGFTCQTPVFHNGALSVVVGQETGVVWTSSNIIYVPSGYTYPAAAGAWCNGLAGTAGVPQNSITGGITCPSAGVSTSGGSLSNGATSSLTYTFSGSVPSVGQGFAGTIWASYQTALGGSSNWYAVKVATITLKAV